MVDDRRYRTRLEILRDVLATAQKESNKTRIIRLANLNPTAFHRYMTFCVENGLLEVNGARYRNTKAGVATVGAIDRILSKAEELGFAVRDLGSVVGRENSRPVQPSPSLRVVAAVAWNELLKNAARSGGLEIEFVDTRPVDPASSEVLLIGTGAPVRPPPTPAVRGARRPSRLPSRMRELNPEPHDAQRAPKPLS
jgi:predicted transcriptional regulator